MKLCAALLVFAASIFGMAAATLLSGPIPFADLTSDDRFAMALVWAGVAVAFTGASILIRRLDAALPPIDEAMDRLKYRYQCIKRNRIRFQRQHYMRREFHELVDALVAHATAPDDRRREPDRADLEGLRAVAASLAEGREAPAISEAA